jgi:hypothetical protein
LTASIADAAGAAQDVPDDGNSRVITGLYAAFS